jgi:DNA primase
MAEYNILKLLDDRGIKYDNAGVHNVKIKCFSGMHEDKKPSLLINSTSGEYHCFACQAKGNIVSYFLENKEISYTDSIYYQKTNYAEKEDKTEQEIFSDLKKRLNRTSAVKEFIEVVEPDTKPIHFNQYLTSRGFNKSDIEKWNIRTIDIINDPYSGWIYIPIYFQGVLRTYFLRSPKSKHKIYGYKYNEELKKNEGYPRRDLLFGYDDIKDFTQPVYLFEGIFDKIWFGRTNKQCLALLGNVISPEQLAHLKKFKKIVLALDNDEASLNIVKSALALLNADVSVYIWRPPPGLKDANECTMRQLIEQTYKEIPLRQFIESQEYEEWSLRNATTSSKFRNS